MDVMVLIVNYRGRELTVDCVRSVQASTGVRLTVVVIDNASGDGSYEYLTSHLSDVTIVAEPVNRGYTGGNNVGLRFAIESGARYAFILNNDTIVDPHCIERLVREADANPDVAMLAPQIRYQSPSDRLWFGGGRFSLWRGRPLHIGFREPLDRGLPDSTNVEFLTGCALLVRMSRFGDIGWLDESLFGYSEDLDWCLRCRRAGHRLRYVPEAVLWHREGYGFQQLGGQALRMYFATRNNLRVFGRHARWYHWITLAPSFLINHLARFTYLSIVRDRDPRAVTAMYRGAWHAIRGGRHEVEPEPRENGGRS